MSDDEGYDVIRFVKHGSECQPVMDYARGEIFVQWLKSHPVVQKEEMFYMMRELMKQLIRLHQAEAEDSYPYVTPYSVFLSESKEVLLLDFRAKSNEVIERQMKRRAIRNNFFPEVHGMRPDKGVNNEIYSLGRTLQFLLTVQEPEPPLGKIEELRLRRIIARCLGNSRERPYKHIEEILKQLPKGQKINQQYPQIMKKFSISSGVLFLVLATGTGVTLKKIIPAMRQDTKAAGVKAANINKTKETEKEEAEEKEMLKTAMPETSEYNTLCMDMGLMHFVAFGDYQKSQEYFEKAEESVGAAVYGRLARYMDSQDITDEELTRLLLDAKTRLEVQTDIRYVQSLLRVYGKMEEVTGRLSEDQYMTMALLAERGNNMSEWKEQGSVHEIEKELYTYRIKGYEGSEEMEKAIAVCLEWLEMEPDAQSREEICTRIAGLYEREGNIVAARETCRKEMQRNEESKKLRLLYLRLQLKDPGVERVVCASTIKEFLDQTPELASEAEFQKIQEDYDIRITDETVSVGV